jgi:hypothetical protein
MFQVSAGESSSIIKSLSSSISAIKTPGTKTAIPAGIDFADVLAKVQSSDVLQYSGSLTTPPCAEGVTFMIVKDPLDISVADFNMIKSVVKFNARYIQNDLGSRQPRGNGRGDAATSPEEWDGGCEWHGYGTDECGPAVHGYGVAWAADGDCGGCCGGEEEEVLDGVWKVVRIELIWFGDGVIYDCWRGGNDVWVQMGSGIEIDTWVAMKDIRKTRVHKPLHFLAEVMLLMVDMRLILDDLHYPHLPLESLSSSPCLRLCLRGCEDTFRITGNTRLRNDPCLDRKDHSEEGKAGSDKGASYFTVSLPASLR